MHWYFEARLLHSVAFFARRHRRRHHRAYTVTYHLHHLFHSSSFIHSRPNLLAHVVSSSPLLYFLHMCAHTFTIFFSLFRIDALSLRMSPLPGARGSSIARPEKREGNDLQRDLWIHPLLPQSCGLKRKVERKNFAERECLNTSLVVG